MEASHPDPDQETRADGQLSPEQALKTFQFYEEAAERTKAHAWSLTTWILTLNAGIFAFSFSLYLDHADDSAFVCMEWMAAGVGVLLSVFLIYFLNELGRHIKRYWTTSNRLAASSAVLRDFIDRDDALAAQRKGYQAGFPAFCRRLQLLATLFIFAHLGWGCIVQFFLPTVSCALSEH